MHLKKETGTRSCDFSACCIASDEPAQIREIICKMKMEIQKKLSTSRYNEMGSGSPGKSQVIWVSIGNKQPPPPPKKKKKIPLEPQKMIVFFESNHWTSVK